MARFFKKCFERICGSCAQICGPVVIICLLAGSSLAKLIFRYLQPVLSFLGERVHIVELLGVLGWGLWIVGLGLPALGWSFCIIAIAPGWPYALYDLMHLGYKQGRRRVLLAVIGLHHLQEYEGAAASPEMHLFATVLAKVPQMAVVSIASAEGRDVMVSGSKENGLLRFVTLAVAFFSGVSIADASYSCVDAVQQPSSHQELGIEEALASQIDGWISRLNTYLLHAIDTLTVVTVVGAVGGHCDREAFGGWLLSLWLLTGLLPALVAPPPMPTLRPALPTWGLKALCHKAAVSILLVASPPTEFMPFLRVTKQRVWAAACLLRAVWLLASAMAFPTLKRPLFAGLEVIHVVVIGALGLATVALIRLLHAEVQRKQKLSRFKPSSSFFSVDSAYDLRPPSLKEPLCPTKIEECPAEIENAKEEAEEVEEVKEAETFPKPSEVENPQEAAQRSDSEAVKEDIARPGSLQVEVAGEASAEDTSAPPFEELDPRAAPDGSSSPDLESQASPILEPPRTGFFRFCCPTRPQDCCSRPEAGNKDFLT